MNGIDLSHHRAIATRLARIGVSMTCEEFIQRNGPAVSALNRYELMFLKEVLSRVGELDFTNVGSQTPFKDELGKPRRVDFTVSEGVHVRIAIEVDGYDKTGRGTGMSRMEFMDFLSRERSMVQQGWCVLRFCNTEVDYQAATCAKSVDSVLRRERSIAELLGSKEQPGSKRADLQEQLRDAKQQAVVAKTQELDGLVKRVSQDSPEAASAVVPATALREYEQLSKRRQDELDHLVKTLAETRREITHIKTIAISMAVAVLVAGLSAVLITKSCADSDSRRDYRTTSSSDPDVGQIPWGDARKHVNKKATVIGPVVSAAYHPEATTKGQPTFLDIGRKFPDTSGVSVTILGVNRKKFPTPPEDTYRDKTIRVTGVIKEVDGVLRIEVDSPNNITIDWFGPR